MYFFKGGPSQNLKIWLKTQNVPHFDLQELATMWMFVIYAKWYLIRFCPLSQVGCWRTWLHKGTPIDFLHIAQGSSSKLLDFLALPNWPTSVKVTDKQVNNLVVVGWWYWWLTLFLVHTSTLTFYYSNFAIEWIKRHICKKVRDYEE